MRELDRSRFYSMPLVEGGVVNHDSGLFDLIELCHTALMMGKADMKKWGSAERRLFKQMKEAGLDG